MPKYQRIFIIQTVLLIFIVILSSCSNPKIQLQRDNLPVIAQLGSDSAMMPDGYRLPIKIWFSTKETAAVVLAVHGFNDYSNAFDTTAIRFADNQITTYAIDQRGFGATEQRGVWAGSTTMQSDLIETIGLLCAKHAGLPIFLLGESMGSAVILSVIQQLKSTCIQGVVLMAPAVWGWQVMPWWQTVPLRMFAHMMPEVTLTGEGLEIRASDNDEMLKALGQDPLIIKASRIDTVYGLTNLMEEALTHSKHLKMPALILYGVHDEIIPPEAFCVMLNDLPKKTESEWRLMLYPNGYHMLSRDLQGELVIRDMIAWLHDQKIQLPSGQEIIQGESAHLLQAVCD